MNKSDKVLKEISEKQVQITGREGKILDVIQTVSGVQLNIIENGRLVGFITLNEKANDQLKALLR